MAEYLEFEWRTNVISNNIVKGVHPLCNEPKGRTAAIAALKNLIHSCNDYELRTNLPQDDKTLQKFLYARKLNVTESFELLKNYYFYRKRNPDIFKNLTLEAEDIYKALENGLPGVLSQKDRKGRCVLMLTATNWDFSYPLSSIYRALLYSLEYLTNDIHNQNNGFVVIVDWTEFPFRRTTNLKPSVLRLMIEGLQDCFPARFKGIHFIEQPWYVEAALAIIKPTLNDKIKERIYVHGNNLSTLHELVHKDILPAEMGGEQPSYNPRSFLNTLEAKQ
ncbi:clavesin-1 [Anoplophora glabripennis]|uniref:clavesin-1 n=1 Tax=Anoplophora glabripennis TaxID=217634 RepID=UPI000873D42F|nr:clavesin-1 [Anoplophora glabripennis]